ncbi:MAG TPA: M17 family peptidase N-terminal domain-containing protein, partial [bacterium]|nr:M17 family peptidase N-terminal domain-containing protein [bacterium]
MIEIVESFPKSKKAGLCICLVHEGESLVKHSCADEAEAAAAKADGFSAKKDQAFYVPTSRSLFLGLGKEKDSSLESYRRAGMAAARRARDLKVEDAELRLPKGASKEQAGAAAEGAWLGLYKFTEAKGSAADKDKEKAKEPELKRLALKHAPKGSAAVIEERRLACEAVILVRDLVNRGPNEKYPTKYAQTIAKLAKGVPGLSLKVLDKKAIAAWPMAGLMAINQGSVNPPVFIHLHYTPKGKARKRVALVGKGVTFDSGGLSLKPAGSMLDMKCDMAGSATVISLAILAAKLQLPVEIHACAPVTENMPGADAIKIGDIIRYKNGRTAEMLNTDAEGRVILADGLLYAETLKPDVIL